ncbi:MAG TPA: RNA-binding protein [Thermodesulfobacteriota bacterium]|nr:RNA-binding protein [Thermodesulfobacteriota bacterium]
MQSNKLYVGNMDYSVTSEQLKELFSGYGSVTEVKVIEGKGFGFVEMSSREEAEKAKEALNGSDFKGRTLKVDEARPQKSRDSRGGYQGNKRNQGYQGYRGRR